MLGILRRLFDAVAKGISAGARFLGVGSALVIALTAVIVTYNVVQRLTFGASLPGVVDFNALVLVIVAFGGAAQGELAETHVRMSLFADRAGPRIRKLILALSQFIIGGLAIVMLEASYERAIASYTTKEVLNGQEFLPVWPVRFVIVIGLLALLAVCVVKFVQVLMPAEEASTARPKEGPEHG